MYGSTRTSELQFRRVLTPFVGPRASLTAAVERSFSATLCIPGIIRSTVIVDQSMSMHGSQLLIGISLGRIIMPRRLVLLAGALGNRLHKDVHDDDIISVQASTILTY